MYNTKVVCTYNTPEVFLETDNITDDEKTFIRNIIYRQEFLNVLNIDYENDHDDNEEKINVFITVDGVETSYNISNRDIINLGFKPYNLKNVLISYNGIVSDITEKIKNITQNVIEIKLL